jgi:hypothetical protein
MQPVGLDELPVFGVLDQDVSSDGVVYRRLPSWTRPQIVDPALGVLVTMPAGARLEFVTDAREIELDVMLTVIRFGDLPFTRPTFDLVVDGTVQSSVTPSDFRSIDIDPVTMAIGFTPGEPATVRFDDLPGDADQVVEVWLPHAAIVQMQGARISDGATLRRSDAERRRWVHYGSSISHCTETAHPTETWPAIAARRSGVDLMNLAVAGQCMLDQHVARTIRDLDADLISVKAGINVVNGDTMRERTYVAALHGFLDTVRDGHPTTPIVVATPIICPVAEDHPGPTVAGEGGRVRVVARDPELSLGALTLRRIRDLMTGVVAARRAAGDQWLHLLDGLALFGPDDLDDLPDGLHPNADGYRRMGERFHTLVFEGTGPFSGAP